MGKDVLEYNSEIKKFLYLFVEYYHIYKTNLYLTTVFNQFIKILITNYINILQIYKFFTFLQTEYEKTKCHFILHQFSYNEKIFCDFSFCGIFTNEMKNV